MATCINDVVEIFVNETEIDTNNNNGEKGYRFEELFLGYSAREVCNKVGKYFRDKRGKQITDFKELIRITKDIQNQLGNCNPRKPLTELANFFYEMISERIRVKFPEGTLGSYNSAGTPLDYKFGSDLFYSFKFKGCREVIVTVDLTVSSRKKIGDSNAEVILTLGDMRGENYINVVNAIVSRLSHKVIKRINKQKKHFIYQ